MFRRYDPIAGRWLSPDPAAWEAVDLTNPQSFNRYAYALNSPMSGIDQYGLDVTCTGGSTVYGANWNSGSGYTGYTCTSTDWGSAYDGYNDSVQLKQPSSYTTEVLMGPDGVPTIYQFLSVPQYVPPSPYSADLNNPPSGPNAGTPINQSPTVTIGPAPSNGTPQRVIVPLLPDPLHKTKQTQLNQRCAAAVATSGVLAANAGLNEVGAALSGEVTPFAAIFHGIALVEGISSAGFAIYGAFACYNAAQF